MSRSLVLFGILLSFVPSVNAALTSSPERQITLPMRDTAAFDQTDARLASDGHGYFAVWLSRYLFGDEADVFGAFLSDAGVPSGEPVKIGEARAPGRLPAVAFGNGRYLIVWDHAGGLRGRLVGADGSMSAELALAEATPHSSFTELTVAFNGNVFLVIGRAPSSEYRGTIVEADGRIRASFRVMSGHLRSTGNMVALDGTFYLPTAFIDIEGTPNGNGFPAEVKALAIDENGVIQSSVEVAPATTPVLDLQASVSGSRLLVGWTTARDVAGAQVRSALLTREGAADIETTPADGMWLQSIAGDALLYGNEQTHFIRRVGGIASPLAAPAAQARIADAESNGRSIVLLYRGMPRIGFDYGPAGSDLYVGPASPSVFVPLVRAPRHQERPDIAASNDLRLAVWAEYIGRDRRLGIVASRIASTGHSLDGKGIDLGVGTYHATAPRVASDGVDWLVTWVDDNIVYAKRVSHSGAVLDADPIVIGKGVFSNETLHVAWDGTSYVIAYLRGNFFRGIRVRPIAARVSSSGDLLGEIVLAEEGPMEAISIAAGGHGSMIVWDLGKTFDGVLLGRNGSVTPVVLPKWKRRSVAWNGREFLVAGFAAGQLQWQMISASGVERSPLGAVDIPVTNIAGFPSVEAEAFEDGVLLIWNAAATIAADADVRVAFVNGDGLLADASTPLARTVGGFTRNMAAAGGQVVTFRRIGDPVRDVMRVFVQVIERTPNGAKRRAVR